MKIEQNQYRKEVTMEKKGFVQVIGQASKVKNFRHDPNGLKPFFDGLRIPKAAENDLTYLVEEGTLVKITIEQTQKNLFEDEEKT